jgi:hypothetical protein
LTALNRLSTTWTIEVNTPQSIAPRNFQYRSYASSPGGAQTPPDESGNYGLGFFLAAIGVGCIGGAIYMHTSGPKVDDHFLISLFVCCAEVELKSVLT